MSHGRGGEGVISKVTTATRTLKCDVMELTSIAVANPLPYT